MNRKRPLTLLCILLPVLLCLFGAWCIYPDLHQRWLDNQLFAAIQRNDIHAATILLDQGASANAQGNPNTSGSSFSRILTRYLRGDLHADKLSSALEVALGVQAPHAGNAAYSAFSGPDIDMALLLLTHEAVFHPKPGSYVRVYKGWFHHGDQSPYVDIDVCSTGGDYSEDGGATFVGPELQLDLLVRAALKAGGQSNYISVPYLQPLCKRL